MPSTITNVSNTLNANFPPLGQGIIGINEFNNNFKKIKNSFEILSSEIDTLDTTNINLNSSNNFGNSIILNAVFTNTSYKVFNIGLIGTGITNIDYSQGMYQTCSTKGGSILFNVTNPPPSNSIGKLRLEISNETTTTTATCFINFSGNTKFLGSRRIKYVITGTGKLFFDLLPFNQGEKYFVKCLGSDTELFTGSDFSTLFLQNIIGVPQSPAIPSTNVPTIPNPPTPYTYVPPAGWVLRPMTAQQFKEFSQDAAIIISIVNAGGTLESALPITLIQFYSPAEWSTVALNLAKSFRTGYEAFDASFPAMVYDSIYNIHWVYAPSSFNLGYNPLLDEETFLRPNDFRDIM